MIILNGLSIVTIVIIIIIVIGFTVIIVVVVALAVVIVITVFLQAKEVAIHTMHGGGALRYEVQLTASMGKGEGVTDRAL